MRQYQLALLFAFISSVIIGVATLMVSRFTGDVAIVATMAGLFTGLLGFIVVADVSITRSNRRRLEREMETAYISHLQDSRRRIVAVSEQVRKDIALQLHGSVQNKLILMIHRLDELRSEAASAEMASELDDVRRDLGDPLQRDIRSITRKLYHTVLRYGLIPAL